MNRTQSAVLVLVIVAGGAVPVCFAQDSQEGFFQRDFAGAPLEATSSRSVSARIASSSSVSSSLVAGASKDAVAPSFEEIGESEVQPVPPVVASSVASEAATDSGPGATSSAPAPELRTSSSSELAERSSLAGPLTLSSTSASSEDLRQGIKIEQLSLVVNKMNEEHALEVLSTLRELIVDKRLTPGNVYLVGLGAGFRSDALINMVRRLQFLGASFRDNLDKPPVEVNLSPTWIVETGSGRFLLEGTMQIDRFLTSRGEFVKPGEDGAPDRVGDNVPTPAVETANSVAAPGSGDNSAASASSARVGIVPEF